MKKKESKLDKLELLDIFSVDTIALRHMINLQLKKINDEMEFNSTVHTCVKYFQKNAI